MVNASKAFLMAGSVLLSIMVIGALVFMFNTIRGLKTEEARTDDVIKLAEYNKQIEEFNRDGIYGSELLSLANLIEDYNIRQSDLKGYEPITLEVHMTEIMGEGNSKYIKELYSGKNSYLQLTKDFKVMEDSVNDYKKTVLHGQTVDKWANLWPEEQLDFLNKRYSDDVSKVKNAKEDIENSVSKYNIVLSAMTEFKNRRFNRPQTEYDANTGRVSKMVFTQTAM